MSKPVCVCAVHGYNERPDLGVGDGQGVHPDAPAAPLVLDGMIKQNTEDGVHHLCDFLLLAVPRVDEAQGEHPLLPHRALQQAPETSHEYTASRTGPAGMLTHRAEWSARCGSSPAEVFEFLPAVLSAVIEQLDHVGQEDLANLHALRGWG